MFARKSLFVVALVSALLAALLAGPSGATIHPAVTAHGEKRPVVRGSSASASGDSSPDPTCSTGTFEPSAGPTEPCVSRTPNGWLLRPAGVQIGVNRTPTGVAVSPDGNLFAAVTSGQFEQALLFGDRRLGSGDLETVSDLFQGVVIDNAGDIFASGGDRNRIWQFKAVADQVTGIRQIGPVPGAPSDGIPAFSYPGNMVLGSDQRLYVAGNLSMPQSFAQGKDATADLCPRGRPESAPATNTTPAVEPICSYVNIIDVSNTYQEAGSYPKHLVPVGRDAYGLALNETAGKLYVTNWADETNAARAGGTGTLSIVDISTPGAEKEVDVIPVGHHPTGIAMSPDHTKLAVTNSDDDTVNLFDLGADGQVTSKKVINMRPTPHSPRGVTPLDVAWGPGSKRFYVALAGVNALEVRRRNGLAVPRTVTLRSGGKDITVSVPHTYVPTGWYPDAVEVGRHPRGGPICADCPPGAAIYVANGKGSGTGAGCNCEADEGTRTEGTVSVITREKNRAKRREDWARWTKEVVENNHWDSLFAKGFVDASRNACVPAPLPSGKTTFSHVLCAASKGKIDPHKLHVVYIVKENKSFDSYFGDIKPSLPDADAQPHFLQYGQEVTTNQHNLAETFTLMDNFWADSEQSSLGHSWTSAGYANEHNELTWPAAKTYDLGARGDRWGGQYDGQTSGPKDPTVAAVEGGYMREPYKKRFVDLLADPSRNPKHLSYRIFSQDVDAASPAKKWQVPEGLWGLGPNAPHKGGDLDFPDTDRANMFIDGKTISHAWTACDIPCTGPPNPPPPSYGQEISFSPKNKMRFSLTGWEEKFKACRDAGRSRGACQTAMPNFLYVALPVDHTLGFNPYMPTPASMVGDNDKAVGQITAALSKSPFWKNTLIMITEDDTQATGDHVDAHRTFLLSAGGLSRTLGKDGKVSHQLGSFPSILKTTEVLLGLPPLTEYDKGAVPLHGIVVKSLAKTNNVTYNAASPAVPTMYHKDAAKRNPPGTVLGDLSAKLNWHELDEMSPVILRDIMYAGLRGWALKQRDLDLLGP
jgi:DNA-binding beta-propeller fold protein YncE